MIYKLNLREDKNARTKSFYLINPYVKIDNKFLNFLKKFSNNNQKCDVRICVHENPESIHHDMLLYQKKGNYYPPHKHNHCGDTYHVIEGKLACFLFSNSGEITYSCVIKKMKFLKHQKKFIM